MSSTISKFRGVRRRRLQAGQSPIITVVEVMFVVVLAFGIYLYFANTAAGSKINDALINDYGVKVVSVNEPLFDKSTMVIERDDKQFRCDYPSVKTVESKTPLTCGDALNTVGTK